VKALGKVFGIIAIIIVAAFASQIGKVVGKNAASSYSSSKQDAELEAILLKTSTQLNRQLPMMVDEETRLDLTIATGMTLTYKFTMINHMADEYDKYEFYNQMKNFLVKNQCSQENTKIMLRAGVSYNYLYFGKNGNILTTIKVTRADCY